jgi:uncharacterized protein (DUF433 family)
VGWSETALADRWRWSREKVRNFLNYLKTVQQIDRQINKTLSRIIIINYDKYQLNQTTDRTTDRTNDNNDNNVNNISGAKAPRVTTNLIENKNMGWGNNRGDEADESVVDYDGDGTIKSTAPVSKAKYPHAAEVRKVFLRILGRNPANWKVNRTELQACENLYTERGIEKIEAALNYYKKYKEENPGDAYFIVIDSPFDLDSKWTKLGAHKLKQQ